MSSETTTSAVDTDAEKATEEEKSATLHLIPNSETFHLVKTIPAKKSEHAEDGEDGAKKKSATLHRLPNSETLHLVK